MADFGEINPTWLQVTPQLFTQTMESGARLGLERAAQELRSREASDRLRLAYDQLGEESERRNQELQMKMMNEREAMQLHRDQLASQDAWRQGQLANQGDLNDIRSAHYYDQNQRLLAALAEKTKLAEQKAGESKYHYGTDGSLWEQKPGEAPVKIREGKGGMSDLQKFDLNHYAKAVDSAQRALNLAIRAGDEDAAAAARNDLKDAQAAYTKFRNGLFTTPPKETGGSATEGDTGKAAPYPNGQILQSKKDNKLYRVENGVPVPVEPVQMDEKSQALPGIVPTPPPGSPPGVETDQGTEDDEEENP
jgi:hypothetical protein